LKIIIWYLQQFGVISRLYIYLQSVQKPFKGIKEQLITTLIWTFQTSWQITCRVLNLGPSEHESDALPVCHWSLKGLGCSTVTLTKLSKAWGVLLRHWPSSQRLGVFYCDTDQALKGLGCSTATQTELSKAWDVCYCDTVAYPKPLRPQWSQ
jgi:hypothetical protein